MHADLVQMVDVALNREIEAPGIVHASLPLRRPQLRISWHEATDDGDFGAGEEIACRMPAALWQGVFL